MLQELKEKLTSKLGKKIIIENYGVFQMNDFEIYLSRDTSKGYLQMKVFDIRTIFERYGSKDESGNLIPLETKLAATYENLKSIDSNNEFTSYFDQWKQEGLIE